MALPVPVRLGGESVTVELLTAQDLMQCLHLSRDAVYRGARSGRIPGALKVLGQLRFDSHVIERWLNEECALKPASGKRFAASGPPPLPPRGPGNLRALAKAERGAS